MLRIFSSLFVFLLPTSSNAQADRFSEVAQVKGKEVYVVDNSAVNVVYLNVDGKVKPASKVKNALVSLVGQVFTVENNYYVYKKNNYLVLKKGDTNYLLKEQDSPLYLSSFLSKSYWQNKYDTYSKEYAYLDYKKWDEQHTSQSSIVYDDLTNIVWHGFDMTETGALYYMSELVNDKPLRKFKVDNKFFDEHKDTYFIKKDNIQPYIEHYDERIAKEKREQEIQDSIQNQKLCLAISHIDATFGPDSDEVEVSKGDTLAVYSYNRQKDKFSVRFRYSNLLFERKDFYFLDNADEEYLKSKEDDGLEQRFIVAVKYDELHTGMWWDNLIASVNQQKREIANMKKNQIFITGIGYRYNHIEHPSQFGMYFDIYNCFGKTIKYVDFTLTNYNAVGDVQRDDIGRATRTVRGIGPIEPTDGGRYAWNDIFWDDRDIIDRTRLTNIKFTFKDGTTKVFSGATNIRKHMTADAWDNK